MICFPPVAALPKWSKCLAIGFVVCLGFQFLPDRFFPELVWREHLEDAGLEMSNHVAIQERLALETTMLFVATMMVGLWLLGQRVSAARLPGMALWFSAGVAGYAILSFVFREELSVSRTPGQFGFFPNRNHTATLLAMGGLTALGCLIQALKADRRLMIGVSLLVLAICIWAVVGWSASRAGVLLILVGTVLWLFAMGPGYLRGHTRIALVLVCVAVVGGFLVFDSQVKERLFDSSGTGSAGIAEEGGEQEWDFRIPTWFDTLGMIRDRPWTGFGAGHFRYVFPQYRERTTVANETKHLHPESDWLWLAAELGVFAVLTICGFVSVVFVDSWRRLCYGRARAVRGGCLVAALALLVHSFFDVPGHRVPLVWGGAVLLSLSWRAVMIERSTMQRWPSLVGGTAVLGYGVWLLFGKVIGIAAPLEQERASAVEDVAKLYERDRLAREVGEQGFSEPVKDPLVKALRLITNVGTKFPLDSTLRHSEGVLAMKFVGREAQVRQAFEIERLLEPMQPATPIRQAIVWVPHDVEESRNLLEEAERRAIRLDGMGIRAPQRAESWTTHLKGWVEEFARAYPEISAGQ